MSRSSRALLACALLSVILSGARPARAGDQAAADALFDEGKALMAKGEFAQACAKFQASHEAAAALGTLLNLADCLEQAGRLGSAERRFAEALAFAEKNGDERAGFARERLAALTPRVPRLVLEITAGSEPLVVALDAEPVDEKRFGLPVPVDPGKRVVSVRRAERVLEQREFEAREGATERLAFDLAAIAKKHPAPSQREPVEDRPEQRAAGIVILSTGLAALSAFVVLEVVALSFDQGATDPGSCADKGAGALACSPQGAERLDDAATLAEVGQWLGVGGLAATGVGITLLLTLPNLEEPEGEIAVLPLVGPGFTGLSLRGAF